MNDLMKALLQLVGREALTDGVRCQIIDILPHVPDPRIVLRECGVADEIQADQHGDPRRWTHRTHTVALHGETGGLHPVLRAFLHDGEEESLLRLCATRKA